MSRFVWAWFESCVRAVRGAWEQSGCEVRANLGGWLRFGGLSATRCLVVLMTACSLSVGAVAAPAWAASAGGLPGRVSSGERVAPVDAVVLRMGSGCASGSPRVRGLQRRLAGAGFSPGRVDGCYGPQTEDAVARFQAARGLRVDGTAGRVTLAALLRRSTVLYPGAGYTAQGSGQVRALQRRLREAGFSPGPIDGRYGPRTERAVARFQAAHGLGVDGTAGPETFTGLEKDRVVEPRSAHRTARQPTRAHGTSPGSQPPARAPQRAVPPAPHPHPGKASGSSSTLLWVVLAVLGVGMIGIGAWVDGARLAPLLMSASDRPAPATSCRERDWRCRTPAGCLRVITRRRWPRRRRTARPTSAETGWAPRTLVFCSSRETVWPTPQIVARTSAALPTAHLIMLVCSPNRASCVVRKPDTDRPTSAPTLMPRATSVCCSSAARTWPVRRPRTVAPTSAATLTARSVSAGCWRTAGISPQRWRRTGGLMSAGTRRRPPTSGCCSSRTAICRGAEAAYQRADDLGDADGAF